MAAVAAADAGEGVDVPLLVRVLAGNPVTSTIVLSCLNTPDTRPLRRLHPAVAGVVARVPWCGMDTPVVDAVRWRAGLPAAVGAWLSELPVCGRLTAPPPAVLGGITHLNLQNCYYVKDIMLLRLPTSLHTLNVSHCRKLTGDASFTHLTALTTLDCSATDALSKRTDGLPSSLQVLDISYVHGLRPRASLVHLHQLRVLHANGSALMSDFKLASLPPSLEELHAESCKELTPAATFAHFTALRKLVVAYSTIFDASLATMPPSLVSLFARECKFLTSAAVLPHLPALQLLDVSDTDIGDALVASLPASLVELRLTGCHGVTASARLDHLHALRVLNYSNTKLAPATLAACRARGCVVPIACQLRGHGNPVGALAVLGDGRLASGDEGGIVRLWNTWRGGEATAVLEGPGGEIHGLVALPDGHRLAIGTYRYSSYILKPGGNGYVEVWDAGVVPPTRCTTIDCGSGVEALTALPDGRLAAGCADGSVRLVEVGTGTGAVTATLKGHTCTVYSLAVLPDGTLASGSADNSVRLWDVGAQTCVATLAGHTSNVYALTVLADGRLASGSIDKTVRLWDVATRACVGVLEGHRDQVFALAALPDGRLASGSADKTVRVWDTRSAAAAGASRAAATVPVEVVGVLGGMIKALLSLPDGRLACGGYAYRQGAVWLLERPAPPLAAYD